jgi:hypothetical protein
MSTRKRRPNTIKKERVKIPAITQRETPQKPSTFRREKESQIPNFVKRIAEMLLYTIMVIIGYIITNFLSH